MSTSLQSGTSDSGPRRGLPRWAWVLIGLLTVIAIVAVAIAVFAARGRQVVVLPPEPTPSASASPTPSPSPPAATPVVTLADGCLGGATELDRAVLTAQRDAPLTAAGAAAFAATFLRWATATPAPPFQDVTAEQVLTDGATSAARALSGTRDPAGSTFTTSFAEGEYYIEAFDETRAIVSLLGTASGTSQGVPQGEALVAGTITLDAVNGTWRLQDLSEGRSLADLQRIGTPYSGGC